MRYDYMNTKKTITEDFKLLTARNIIDILDGDTKFDTFTFENGKYFVIAMPYLTGQMLCRISTQFGLVVRYNFDTTNDKKQNKSRWTYLTDLFEYCISNDTCSNLLLYLFSQNNFTNEIFKENMKGDYYGYQNYQELNDNEIDFAYKIIIERVIKEINELLKFSQKELVIVSDNIIIKPITDDIKIETPKIQIIDRKYIRDKAEQAMHHIDQGQYDTALTQARTLLEEIFCYVLEKKNIKPAAAGKIGDLYKQVREAYNMHTDDNTDKRVKKLLSGLNTIVDAIAEMRNQISDAHGQGEKRISIRDYHAQLAVNSAITISEFILSVYKYTK
jgi:hypothetical protein